MRTVRTFRTLQAFSDTASLVREITVSICVIMWGTIVYYTIYLHIFCGVMAVACRGSHPPIQLRHTKHNCHGWRAELSLMEYFWALNKQRRIKQRSCGIATGVLIIFASWFNTPRCDGVSIANLKIIYYKRGVSWPCDIVSQPKAKQACVNFNGKGKTKISL